MPRELEGQTNRQTDRQTDQIGKSEKENSSYNRGGEREIKKVEFEEEKRKSGKKFVS